MTVRGPINVMMSQQDTHQLATATTASVQALAAALQQQSLQPGTANRLSLPPFWPPEPAAWFPHVEAEFLLARVLLTSYLCYLHIIRALPPDIIASIRDITRHLTAESLDAYDIVKQALLERFTTSELQRCYQLRDAPALGDRNIVPIMPNFVPSFRRTATSFLTQFFSGPCQSISG
jgi:hypothetical protein